MESMEYISERVERIPSGCWNWKLGVNSWGYGRVRSKARFGERLAHRIAYRAFVGPIHEGMLVLHSCDNPRCCNPKHLFLGTHASNVADMENKGRSVHPHGEQCGKSKLTLNDVKAIRCSSENNSILGRKFKVDRKTIRLIKQGATWAL